MRVSEDKIKDNQKSDGQVTREDIRDLPPSAKLVVKVLEYNDMMSQKEIADETLLPQRTVRYALNRLDEKDAIDIRISFQDARKRLYALDMRI